MKRFSLLLCISLLLTLVSCSTGEQGKDPGATKVEECQHQFVNNECACGAYQESEGLVFTEYVEGSYVCNGLGTCRDTCVVIPATYNGKPVDAFWPLTDEAHSQRIEKIVLPDSIKKISPQAFRQMNRLKTVVLSKGINKLEEYTFYDCPALEEIVIPKGVVTIERFCFQKCTALKTVVLPETLREIKDYAFEGCTALEKITLPSSVCFLRYRAFSGCKLLQVSFAGTKEQFGNLRRENGWCHGIVSRVITCSDGNYIVEEGKETS